MNYSFGLHLPHMSQSEVQDAAMLRRYSRLGLVLFFYCNYRKMKKKKKTVSSRGQEPVYHDCSPRGKKLLFKSETIDADKHPVPKYRPTVCQVMLSIVTRFKNIDNKL